MTATPHLLIVDDDKEICTLLTRFLTPHGYRISVARDGRGLDHAIENGKFDLVILDLMLPGEDGLSICRRLRAKGDIPIIMLTALAQEPDRIVGLEMGADDYLPKDANPRELLARIRSVLRRAKTAEPAIEGARLLEFGGWRLDVARRQLFSPSDAMVALRPGEFELLLALAERPQRVLNRDQLLDLSRGREASLFDRSIDVQISRLRRKIEEDPREPLLIKTVRGGGYVLACTVTIRGYEG